MANAYAYPSVVSDEAWAFVLPYLLLSKMPVRRRGAAHGGMRITIIRLKTSGGCAQRQSSAAGCAGEPEPRREAAEGRTGASVQTRQRR